jgi:methyl-accepting chemotaxis protein
MVGLMALVSVVALANIGFLGTQLVDSVYSGKERFADTLAEETINKIDRNLFERYGDVQAYAVHDAARSGDPARMTTFINAMMGTYAPVYDLMVIVNTQGRVVAANTIDKAGNELATASLLGKDYSGSAWFKAIMKPDFEGTFVEDLYIDSDVASIIRNDGRVMSFSAPIRDPQSGRILGIWSNRMSWADVVEDIAKKTLARLNDGGQQMAFPFLISSKGRYLMHPDAARVLRDSDPQFDQLVAQTQKGTHHSLVELNESFFKGTMMKSSVASTGFETYPSQGWTMQVGLDSSDPLITQAWWEMAIAFALQLGLLAFGFFVARSVVRSFTHSMSELAAESTEVRKAADTISHGANNLASASTEQASALQETASSVEEISAMIKKSSENAMQSKQVAESSAQAAARGKEAVGEMIRSIGEIHESNERIMKEVDQSNKEITEIIKVITEIGNKTKVINDIVFQTKLLSFNASVEAARAGEHGKGFAVVAEEVGNLAQMSGNAAKEISDMLNGSIQKVENIVEQTSSRVERLISDGKSKVEQGTVVARQCGDILEDVVKSVQDVNRMVSEIASASQEQSTGVGEITKAMNQLDQVTHENATTSQESAAAAEQLSRQSDELMQIVSMLNELVNGSGAEVDQASAKRLKDATHKLQKATKSLQNEMPAAAKMDWKPLKKESSAAPHKANGSMKKASAVGADFIPSEDDPRFKDF